MKGEKYISIGELAKMLGISRIAVYKKVVKGRIKAAKIGRNYAIPLRYLKGVLGKSLTAPGKRSIDKAVKKTVAEYGEVLKLLGNA